MIIPKLPEIYNKTPLTMRITQDHLGQIDPVYPKQRSRDVLRLPRIIAADQSRLSQAIIPKITRTDIYPVLNESVKSLVPNGSLGPIADPTDLADPADLTDPTDLADLADPTSDTR